MIVCVFVCVCVCVCGGEGRYGQCTHLLNTDHYNVGGQKFDDVQL